MGQIGSDARCGQAFCWVLKIPGWTRLCQTAFAILYPKAMMPCGKQPIRGILVKSRG